MGAVTFFNSSGGGSFDLFTTDTVKLGRVAGDEIEINTENDARIIPSEVYKRRNSTTYNQLVYEFDNSDRTDFQENQYVEFTGTAQMQTQYNYETVEEGDLQVNRKDGKQFSTELNLTHFKTVMEVI